MTSNAAVETEPRPISACTVARDVQNFDLLIEDMEEEMGEAWGDLSFPEGAAYLEQPDAAALEFIVIAIDAQDETGLTEVSELITLAKQTKVKVILVAENVSPIALHQMLKLGADDFIPYPLPDNALHESIERVRKMKAEDDAKAEMESAKAAENAAKSGRIGTNNGVIIPVHGLAGGTGASTFAVNLAWELAVADKSSENTVCLIDLDFQFGSVSTYLDLPRKEAVYELLSDAENLDDDTFMATLLAFNDRIKVLTAPADMLPLDLLGSAEIEKIIQIAQRNFDYVVIDMPSTLVQWTETMLTMAHVYFGVLELDLRSAQNTLRLIRALKSEDLPYEKIRYVLNRAPKFTDMAGKSRAKRMAESLDIDIELFMPDGGKAVPQSCDHGQPLAETAAKNPLRKEILKLAKSLHELNQSEETGA